MYKLVGIKHEKLKIRVKISDYVRVIRYVLHLELTTMNTMGIPYFPTQPLQT
jgi:hypothetical protein